MNDLEHLATITLRNMSEHPIDEATELLCHEFFREHPIIQATFPSWTNNGAPDGVVREPKHHAIVIGIGNNNPEIGATECITLIDTPFSKVEALGFSDQYEQFGVPFDFRAFPWLEDLLAQKGITVEEIIAQAPWYADIRTLRVEPNEQTGITAIHLSSDISFEELQALVHLSGIQMNDLLDYIYEGWLEAFQRVDQQLYAYAHWVTQDAVEASQPSGEPLPEFWDRLPEWAHQWERKGGDPRLVQMTDEKGHVISGLYWFEIRDASGTAIPTYLYYGEGRLLHIEYNCIQFFSEEEMYQVTASLQDAWSDAARMMPEFSYKPSSFIRADTPKTFPGALHIALDPHWDNFNRPVAI